MENTQKNIHLEGIAYNCSIKNHDDGRKVARIDIFTPVPGKGKEPVQKRIFNRILVPVNDQNENEFVMLSLKCGDNLKAINAGKKIPKKDTSFIIVDGTIIGDQKEQDNSIIASSTDISFPEEINLRRQPENILEGNILEVFKNENFASIVLQVAEKDNKRTLVPVYVKKKENLKLWNDIGSKIKKGENVTVTGMIASNAYISENEKKILPHMDAKSISLLDIKKTKSSRKTTSLKQ